MTLSMTADGHQASHWIGLGAEKLGLKPGDAVTREAFLRLCDNQHPTSSNQLTQVTARERRIFFDFQCAPPKSVSILAVTMDDQRILQAHREASTLALRELEQFAATRIRKGGIEDKDRVTGNLVGAAFTHTSSRALDPQLHTHFVLFNCTWDKTEQRWKALQTSGMFDAIHYGTEVYRNELASRLHQLGYAIRRTGSAFEIEGVSPKLIEQFSKRSKERDIAVAREEKRLGRKLTKDEVAHVVHQTRPKKLKGISDEEVREQQLREIGFFEKRALRKIVEAANGQPQDFAQRVTTDEAIEHGLQHVFERHSVAPQHRILEAALIKSCGQLALEPLKEKLREHPELVWVGSEFSTRDILTKELFLIRTVNAGIDAVRPIADHYKPPSRLGPDQRAALVHVLTSPDRVTGFRGLAGSGKSTALVELARVFRNERFEPVFCAPTASAADTLRKESLATMTLQKLLVDPATQHQLSTRSVIVLDEAGAVGLDDMVKLFEVARLKDCRVVLSGDTGQHASVARGDALRILEQYSRYRFSELTTIRRQKPEAFRQAVKLAAAKKTDKAFAKLLELGAVTETLTDEGQLYQKAADAYLAATKEGKSALLVSPTWAEIDAVTEKVRATLKAEGVVGQHEEAVTVFDSLSWTEAQKKHVSHYEPGQRLRFVRSTKTFAKGETVEVAGVQDNTLKLRRADGSEASLKLGAGTACFDVGEARELKVAAGDWLLLQANHGKDFINGERVQVRRLAGRAITLTDGRVLPSTFNTFTHGYAVTSHSSQSQTVDEVLLVASSRSFGAVNREQFYVSISRGRERCHVFTDDAELLARRVTDSHERKAAVELQALRDQLARLGFLPRQQLKKEAPQPAEPTQNTRPRQHRLIAVRQQRPMALRQHRTTRLSLPQRLTRWADELRHWLCPKPDLEHTQAVADKPTVKQRPTLREQVQRAIDQIHQQQNRPSRGYRP
ncbi:MAG: relaxase domain-containing protein [Verrucomicrobiales bacterium]|nr:relaxase domain-containing protein [Verrucomicrobiales bacterium]